MNTTLIEQHADKIRKHFNKYRQKRQADNGEATLDDGIDVQINMEVASSMQSSNNGDAINVSSLSMTSKRRLSIRRLLKHRRH